MIPTVYTIKASLIQIRPVVLDALYENPAIKKRYHGGTLPTTWSVSNYTNQEIGNLDFFRGAVETDGAKLICHFKLCRSTHFHHYR